jgi:hypothetical protein
MRRAALFFVGLLAVPAALQAQRCVGQAPWSAGSLKVGGSLEFGSTAVAGGIGVGKDKGLFGNVEAGVWSPGSQFFLRGGIGKELSKPITDKLELCPIAQAAYFFPKNDFSEFDISGGVSVGYPIAMNSKNITLALIGSGQLGWRHVSLSDCGLTECSSSDVIGIFGAGAGFIFNNRISLVPQLVLPTSGGTEFLIIANVAIGKK